ncbi:MAG: FAD-dependent oxidoreductase, partial [Planctomycetota bacterium]
VREGYFYVRHAPIQVPYGVLLPRKIGRLLVPVCCSASHVGYQTLRMEPVYMALGQASGAAAHLAIARGVELHEVPVEDLQIALVEQGAVVTHYDDLPFDHPAFAALQFLGARGLNPDYQATPELKLPREWGWVKLGRILAHMKIEWTPPDDRPDDPLTGADVVAWLGQLGWLAPDDAARPLLDRQLNLAEYARLVYQAYKASRSSE